MAGPGLRQLKRRDRADARLASGRGRTAPLVAAGPGPGAPAPRTLGADAWLGYPGPAPAPEPGEPLRVVTHTTAAWGEGMEAWLCYLAEGMAAVAPGAVEWYYLVDPPIGRSVPETAIGAALAEWGEVRILPALQCLRRYAVLQAILDWRPHVGQANGREGLGYLTGCGLPVVFARDGIAGATAPAADGRATVVVNHAPVAGPGGREITNGLVPPPWPETRDLGLAVYVGRLDVEKAPELLLDAVAMVPGVRLAVIGRANRRAFDVNAEAARRGIADRVRWHGHLPAIEARTLAAQADIVVHPCDEGFGYGLAEAIAGGAVPVVVAGRGYQVDLARAGEGYVCPATPAGLAEGLRAALAEDRPEAERRRVARRFAETYAATAMAAGYLEAYRDSLLPTVDIVVLAHNEAQVTRDCLLAVLANTWGPYRLILVDNGSTDPAVGEVFRAAAALATGDCLLLRSDTNLGCAGGRRLALQHCTSEYVVTLDNDMLVPPGWLGRLVGAMRAHPEAGAIGAWWAAYGDPPPCADILERRFGCAAAILRRAALPENAYAAPLEQQVGQDTEVLWAMLEEGWHLYLHPQVYWHHIGGPPGLLGMTRRHVMSLGAEAEGRRAFQARWAGPGRRRGPEE